MLTTPFIGPRRNAKQLLPALLPLCALLVMPATTHGQGCVQSRGASVGALVQGEDAYLSGGEWQASVGYRWLYSDRHYVGDREQYQRKEQGSDVRNDSHFVDLGITYAITKRVSVGVTLPFVYSVRSSLYEHDGKNRHEMTASGLADVRLISTVWILDPNTHHEGNFSLGLGVKAPTGDAEVKDTSYTAKGEVQRYVDQSIQPGDGGWGIIIEAQGFQKVVGNLYGYAQASYLISPQEKNEATGYSTPDTYLLRGGLSYAVWPSHGLALSLGWRMEGVMVRDWFGGSEGSRRPGYSMSIEPGITWVHKKLAMTVTAPVAVERNRQWSVQDMRRGRQGDAAFADFIITSSIAYRF